LYILIGCRNDLKTTPVTEALAFSLTLTSHTHTNTHRQELVSEAASLAFAVVNGIPNMLVSDARKLSDSEKSK
jgi:uncharacterized protein YbaR (Trm112 family)